MKEDLTYNLAVELANSLGYELTLKSPRPKSKWEEWEHKKEKKKFDKLVYTSYGYLRNKYAGLKHDIKRLQEELKGKQKEAVETISMVLKTRLVENKNYLSEHDELYDLQEVLVKPKDRYASYQIKFPKLEAEIRKLEQETYLVRHAIREKILAESDLSNYHRNRNYTHVLVMKE